MSGSGSLNLANYTPVWNDNFGNDTQLNSSLFPIAWGDGGEYSFGNGGLTLTSDGNAAGFMTSDQGAGASFGYGLYQATFTMPQNQAPGAYICLWPASNNWPGPEIDFVEQANGQQYFTVHWAGADGSNQYQSTFFNANVSQPTTVAADWEANGLTFYVNGQEAMQFPSGGAVPVPVDAAHGGENEAFGVGNVGPAGTSVTILDMSYSQLTGGGVTSGTGGGGGSSSGGSGSGSSGGTGGGTTGGDTGGGGSTPSAWINISDPGTVTAAGGGATQTVTISDPGLTTAYAAVFNSANQAESGWNPVALDASGTGSFTANFQNSGDYVVAVSDPNTLADSGWSAPITITGGSVNGSPPSFLSSGDPNATSSQWLATTPGTDILQGGSGLDVFTVDATNPDGWAEIDNFHSGDVLSILGFQPGVSTIDWTTATDPNGQSGATAEISLAGNGQIDSAITLPGLSVGDAEALGSGNWQSASGTPELNLWRI
jgi:hypothetical protein